MENKKLIHRDISWLSFNERVLQEAKDLSNPIYERLKFLAIFSSNLDEFYRVRVSKLREFNELQKGIKKKFEQKPKSIIKEIQKKVESLQHQFGLIFKNDILADLVKNDIYLLEENQFSEDHLKFVKTFFKDNVKEHIKVYNLNQQADAKFVKDKHLYLCLDYDKETVLISIPTEILSRFVVLSENQNQFSVTFLEEIVRANLSEINLKFKDCKAYAVKITTDAELYFDEDSGELVDLIKQNLSQREHGIPTRMLYDLEMPRTVLKRLRKHLNLSKTDLMPGGRFHNFSDFFSFPSPNNKQLFFKELTPLIHPDLEYSKSLLKTIKKQDILLNFPYQKYDYVTQTIIEAAQTPEVHSVNITLYRLSKDSEIADALLQCLEQGKNVTVFIEAKARFDEENNIFWGEKLKQKGANVLYSMPNIKVHSKIFLIEADTYNISYIGTGNFNEKNAKIYTDFSLLTADKTIASDIKNVFSYLKEPLTFIPKVETILMSPFVTRNTIYKNIDREIVNAKQGKKAALFFKMNSLEDKGIINKLYDASQAGVEVKLIVRGIFRLVPGVKGLSENIKAISIVGRFLEHGRIYSFYNNGNEELYIASADFMTRNLDKRVEVATPINDSKIKHTLQKCLEMQWEDNCKSRVLDAEQSNQYNMPITLKNNNSQNSYYTFLKTINSL